MIDILIIFPQLFFPKDNLNKMSNPTQKAIEKLVALVYMDQVIWLAEN